MTTLGEPFQPYHVTADDRFDTISLCSPAFGKEEAPTRTMIPESSSIGPSQYASLVPRIQPPTRPAPAPPVAAQNDKSLPPTPQSNASARGSTAPSPYSQASTPGCGQYFQLPPTTPPPSGTASYQPMTSRSRRRKSRSPSYLPLEAYPPGPNSPPSTAYAIGQYYNTTPPSSTPSLSPPTSAHNSPLPTHSSPPTPSSSRRSSLAPRPSRSYPASALQTPYSSTFSPTPFSATSGRPTWYTQDQYAQRLTPDQEAAQSALQAEEARKGSISGLLASAAASLTSPMGGGMEVPARGPILPGGGSQGSSRRGSFSELTGERKDEGKGPWGFVVGWTAGVGKKVGEVEGGVWKWARGR
ncbi:hypothetical protein CAC42_125 [Sphaceloma murrayae]|uniref:Uncharacterized protein n=1 Tax=Sphaceloma murrayae TaxID=2082308 RepID=A0A2K1QN11_9PEZI|nr:hypothetical protein CAC42_125 [Sphaceloma murrayae]